MGTLRRKSKKAAKKMAASNEDRYYGDYDRYEELDWPSTKHHYTEERYPGDERDFNHDGHRYMLDDEFMDVGQDHRYETELDGERHYDGHGLYGFDSDAEEQRWYSKYEGGDGGYSHHHVEPLEEQHHDRRVYREEREVVPYEKFEFEWDTIAHPYDHHDYDEASYRFEGQPHSTEELYKPSQHEKKQ